MNNMPFTQEDNAVYSLYAFVKALKVKVSKHSLKESLLNQPEYPSLFALSQALDEWKIENAAVKVPKDALVEVPTPFLAFLNTGGGSYSLVKSIGESVEWLDSEKGWQKEHLADFAKKYKGTVLVAEANEASGEQDYAAKRKQEIMTNLRLPFVLCSAFIFVMYGFYLAFDENTSWNIIALAIVKLVGLVVSSLLLWYQTDKGNAFVKNLCQLNRKTNCDSILSSKAANLFSWLSWI